MLRNCLAYFSQNPQIQNWCIYWWDLCSLAAHYFLRAFLSVYFCFACQICAHAQFFGKIKTNASRQYILSSTRNMNSTRSGWCSIFFLTVSHTKMIDKKYNKSSCSLTISITISLTISISNLPSHSPRPFSPT